jgi:hypothetical protein
MALRYWVPGGNGVWATAAQGGSTNNWSASSGGASGASIPVSSDDAIFDGGSGSGSVNIVATPAAVQIKSVVATNFTGSFSGSGNLQITGGNTVPNTQNSGKTFELGVGMTAYTYLGQITLSSGNGSGSINFNGKSHTTGLIQFNGATGIWTLINNLTTTGSITITAGTVNTNGYTVTANGFNISGATAKTVNLGSSLINLTGSGTPWANSTGANVTLNAGTSTIRYSNTSNSSCTFLGNSKTYYNFEVARGASTGTVVFQSSSGGNSGSNTFFNFIDNTGINAHSITFIPGSPQTFENFNVRGTSSSARITFIGGQTGLSKIGAGAVICDFLDLGANVTSVTPANTWYAGYNSIGTGPGWVLRNPPGLLLMGVGG